MNPTPAEVREWLRPIPDPELPSVSIVDMGLVGEIRVEGQAVEVELVPTFAGCPAVSLLKEQIAARLAEKGLTPQVRISYTKAWTPDRMAPAAWEALRKAGFAVPTQLSADPEALLSDVSCPRCGSEAVSLTSPFGPTACRAIFRCHACGEAFELFKPPV